MNIVKKSSGRTGKFVVIEDNTEVADIAWLVNDEGNYVIDHTWVSDTMNGKGLGLKLVEAIIEMAREESKKVIPGCRFAQKMFERHKDEFIDVWDKRD